MGAGTFSIGQSNYAADELIVKTSGISATDISEIHGFLGLQPFDIESFDDSGSLGLEKWTVSFPVLFEDEHGQEVQLHNILEVLSTVKQKVDGNNDSDFGLNYDLEIFEPAESSIYGPDGFDPLPYCNEAYDLPAGENPVHIAIIDSGMNPELFADSPSINEGVHYNIVLDRFGNIFDAHGHGTLITSIIDNLLQASEAENATLSMYQIGDDNGEMTLYHLVQAVHRVREDGADLLQLALGYIPHPLDESAFLHEALNLAAYEGVLPVIAAGNGSINTDTTAYYPAGFPLEFALTVAGTDCTDQLATFSNFGLNTIALAAPAEDVLGLSPAGDYYLSSGTSQASALITASAAILATHLPEPRLVACAMQLAVEPLSTLSDKVRTGGVFHDLYLAYDWLMNQDDCSGGAGGSLLSVDKKPMDVAVTTLEPSMQLSPNPSTGDLTILVNTAQMNQGQLRLYSLTGERIDQMEVALEKGSNRIDYQLPQAGISNGTYILTLQTAEQFYQQKVVFTGY